MGQYHKVVNLTKREFIDQYQFGSGAKLLEQHGEGSVSSALHLLLACSSGRGGGDYQSDNYDKKTGEGYVGRWAGDRIAIVGDYAEDGDLPKKDHAGAIYGLCIRDGEKVKPSDDDPDAKLPPYKDISPGLVPVMEREFEMIYTGEGWKDRIECWDRIENWSMSHGTGDRHGVINTPGDKPFEFKMSALRDALRIANEARVASPLRGVERQQMFESKFTLAELKKAGLKSCVE